MMANVKRIKPQTMSVPPSQSILGRVGEFRFSVMSDGIHRYDVTAEVADRIVPIQKYHPHVVYSAVTPAKKIPICVKSAFSALLYTPRVWAVAELTKKPIGAQAP